MNKKIILLPIILAVIIVILLAVFLFVKSPTEIEVFNIKSGQEISSPLVVEGKAVGNWFFEASFPIIVTDESGNILGSSYAKAQSDWMTEDFVPFKGEITFSSKTGGKGFLIFKKDNPSGLPQYDKEIKIPVMLTSSGYTKIKVFFGNNNLDPEMSCNKVFETQREIVKIEAIGSAAINELLKGPTDSEKSVGYFTTINSGVKLLGLSIDKNGTAFADFDEQLEYQVGGSCRVGAIRAQIEKTLKQFSTIENVVISINGRTEDILQP
jgi:hypothetical protein